VLCVCLDVCYSDKCCVFVWMDETETSANFLDVWDATKCCVVVWMCGTQTSAVCFSGCVGFRQVMCVCLDLWDSDKCCVFVWRCGT
jgi:hypothetical protein